MLPSSKSHYRRESLQEFGRLARVVRTRLINLMLACIECNAKKADRTPDQARMPLRREPVRPVWKPLYGSHGMRIDSWSKFVSEAYWTVQLEE